jgi:hypothetical protein
MLNIYLLNINYLKIKINIFINWYFVWLMIFLKKIIQIILIIEKIIIINKKQINWLLYNLLFYNHIQFFLIICNYIDKKAIYWAKK